MKKFLLYFQNALSDLIYGRPQIIKKQTNPRINIVDINTVKSTVSKSNIIEYENVVNHLLQNSDGKSSIILPFEDPITLASFGETYKTHVFNYILRRLSIAINNKLDSIDIFEFGNTKTTAQINSANYETQLNTILKYFLKIEDYESASTCRDLIRLNMGNIMTEKR